ncbi:MAG: histone deacetylase [Blastocatellia bacterium]|nr:histone deacetylase [Blastocatellia bacterium]
MATGLIFSDEYLKHDTGDHPECRERYDAVMNGLMADGALWESLVKLAPREATYEDLLRCHAERVLERVGHACLEAEFYEHAALDSDTFVSRQSDLAARLAAGGACRAVDAVLTGESESAFVACRPPGHHATETMSMGFCLYNNAAIAARYAQLTYPREVRNVMIMDFDVHHGNGTQDIFYADPTVFYYSLHQYPWYPGTGAASERGARDGEGFTLNVPVHASTPAAEYLQMFDEGLDAALKRFAPDLVIISAGFDAHESDPLGQLRLNDESYRHMTRRLKEAAARGRVVSCLEGGYNLRTLGGTVAEHVAALG